MVDKINNVLFDLDGTLTDSKKGIINSILYALKKLNISESKVNELDTFIGPPLRNSFAERYNLSDNLSDKAVKFFREYFSEKGLFENEIYSGIPELLESLFSKRYKLFIATSKPTVYAERILKHFNLTDYFIEIVGSNIDNTRMDKTEIIAHIVHIHNLQAKNTIMVGDRKHDIIGAKNNFIKTVGVTYGYGTLEELTCHRADFIVNNCAELEYVFN